ncbi:AbiH family protein [Lactococcus fujiensis]|uniref:AbiH family protein n=1 Tax=Lactococcus fujiensis TaxID=610251 RepID=UPI0006D0549C|nr:AbiH family protein [Lactococcus fujiensis]
MLDPNIQMPNFSVPKLPDLSSLTRAYPQQVNIVENQKAFNQLVILGNGFDLACGLKSTYRHFFEYILDKDESKNNYWYYIFRSLHYRRVDFNGWTDIEKQILIELKNIEIFYSNGILKENEYIVKEQLEEFISFNGSNPSLRLTASAITSLYSYYYEIPSKKSFQEQLIKKLLLLEEDFCKYLIEQINIEDEQIDDFFLRNKKREPQQLLY